MSDTNITVFFDGLCKVCSFEIEHYKKQSGANHIRFVDITSQEFNAEHEGVDPLKVHKIMHVKKSNGDLVLGPEAFREIWSQLERYRWAYHATDNATAKFFMNIGYNAFLVIRPYLPRKKQLCADSPYCETSKKI